MSAIRVAAVATRNGAVPLFERAANGAVHFNTNADFADAAWNAAVMTAGECERAGAEDFLCAHDPLLYAGCLKHERAARFVRRAIYRLRGKERMFEAAETIEIGSDEMAGLRGVTMAQRKHGSVSDEPTAAAGSAWSIPRTVGGGRICLVDPQDRRERHYALDTGKKSLSSGACPALRSSSLSESTRWRA